MWGGGTLVSKTRRSTPRTMTYLKQRPCLAGSEHMSQWSVGALHQASPWTERGAVGYQALGSLRVGVRKGLHGGHRAEQAPGSGTA